MDEIDILKKNVADQQEQLQKSYIKIKELTAKVYNLSKLITLLLGKVK